MIDKIYRNLIYITAFNIFIFLSILNYNIYNERVETFNKDLKIETSVFLEEKIKIKVAAEGIDLKKDYLSDMVTKENVFAFFFDIDKALEENVDIIMLPKDSLKNSILDYLKKDKTENILKYKNYYIIGHVSVNKIDNFIMINKNIEFTKHHKKLIQNILFKDYKVYESTIEKLNNNSFVKELNSNNINLDNVNFKLDVFSDLTEKILENKKELSIFCLIIFEIFLGIFILLLFLSYEGIKNDENEIIIVIFALFLVSFLTYLTSGLTFV